MLSVLIDPVSRGILVIEGKGADLSNGVLVRQCEVIPARFSSSHCREGAVSSSLGSVIASGSSKIVDLALRLLLIPRVWGKLEHSSR
jgi:hypothetical protein